MKKILSLMIVWVGMASVSESADIVALCIGNDAYRDPVNQLDTSVNDASRFAEALRALPGEVSVDHLSNATGADLSAAVRALPDRARGAKLVLVYYSGHSVKPRETAAPGDLILLPVDAVISDKTPADDEGIGLAGLLDVLGGCEVGARALVLDCGSADGGDEIALPPCTLLASAASAGGFASTHVEGIEDGSPFTHFVVAEFEARRGSLVELFEKASARTTEATGGKQVPFVVTDKKCEALRQKLWP